MRDFISKNLCITYQWALTSNCNYPQYYVQFQLQMLCTAAEYYVLQSYHPETEFSTFFLFSRNYMLMQTVIDNRFYLS